MIDLDVIFAYTRAQAIEDGEQILAEGNLAELVKTNGYLYPLYITSAAWEIIDICSFPDKTPADILAQVLASSHIPESEEGDLRIFTWNEKNFYIQCGATDLDDPAPCLTLMTPSDF